MKCNKKTTAFYMCLALVMAGLMFSGCGKSKGGGGEATNKGNWYQDSDNDGFGNPDKTNNSTEQPEGYVDNSKDCNDENAAINPAAIEPNEKDNVDNNCNGETDEGPVVGIIPDTGQTASYSDISGEDSDYLINAPSYTKLDANGQALPDSAISWYMVRDNVTGLIWELKDASDNVQNLLNIHDADNTYTWEEASSVFIAALNTADFGHFNDGYSWRLPSISELCYISNSSIYNPSITKDYFPQATSTQIWSSTPCANPATKAWYYSPFFGQPALYDKTSKNLAWAVRGEEHKSELESYSPGIVNDKTTGLMWQTVTAKGDDDEGMTYNDALDYCENLVLGGFKDWRLPNKNELASLIRYDLKSPAIETAFFPDTIASWYWTSTTFIAASSGSKSAWQIDFYLTSLALGEKKDLAWVRAVRGGYNKTTTTWYLDSDGDTYGDSAVTKKLDALSPQPTGYVPDHSDCNDADSTISPAAVEIPDDGVDQNCTGSDLFIWYKDNDKDGFGNKIVVVKSEIKPETYIHNSADIAAGLFDCDDSNKSIKPGADELVDDGLDNDCNGLQSVSWYLDSDGDGYGDGQRIVASETAPLNGTYSTNDLDCNDGSADVHPGLVEILDDLFDSNCNGDDDDEILQIVPDTGQEGSYTNVHGDDEDYLINPPSFTKIASDGGFLNENAESWVAIRDNVTGLYWEAKTAVNKNAAYIYENAVDYADGLEIASFNDWRVPTIAELATIANLDSSIPAIDSVYFPNMVSDKYWTVTDHDSDTTSQVISFRYSESYKENKTAFLRVIAVRGGQSLATRLITNDNGTVTDTETGLMWNDLLSTNDTWSNSVNQWSGAVSAGYNDWRLPTESDIETFLDILEEDSSFDFSTVFENLMFTGSFWTSTLAATDPAKAIVFSFITGETNEAGLLQTLRGLGVRGVKQSRFITNDDGTVFDSKTGLMWTKENCNNGLTMSYEGALDFCYTMTFADYSDWRLPNRNEMLSLLASFLEDRDVHLEAFQDSENLYWTSSSCAGKTGFAWQIDFNTGSIAVAIGNNSNPNVFRAVRGGNPE